MDANEELLGADLMEHRIRHSHIGLSRAISALSPMKADLSEMAGVQPIGLNPGHERSLENLRAADNKLQQWQTYLQQMGPNLIGKNSFAADEYVNEKDLRPASRRKISASRFEKNKNLKNQQKRNNIDNYNNRNSSKLTENLSNNKNIENENTYFAWVD